MIVLVFFFSFVLEMLVLLITIIIATLIAFIFLKPLIDNLLYRVSNEPKYIHSYVPFIGFGRELFKDPIGFIRSLSPDAPAKVSNLGRPRH